MDERDPESFGVHGAGLSGMVEVQGNVVRDFAALNRVESLPWDDWGIIERPFPELTEAELALLDQAALISACGGPVDQAVDFYWANPQLHAPQPALPTRAFPCG